MQLAGVLEASLALPDWFDTLVTALLIIAFPVALLLAWAFEMTPDGIRPTQPEAESEARIETARVMDFVLAGALVVIIGLILGDRLLPRSQQIAADTAGEKSIAVLAFDDMSPDGDQQYFSDGIAEEILNALVRVPDLRVAGRTSSFSFKEKDTDVRQIGEALDVGHVLEGSVRKDGMKVRITAQLLRSSDGFNIWSERYDGSLDNIFDLQEQIAQEITRELELRLAGQEGARLIEAATVNNRAYDLYLRGRELVERLGEQNLIAGIGLLERAVEADPDFARGWAALAEAQAVLPGYVRTDREKAYEKARAHAERAIDLQPDLALPHATMGLILCDLDRPGDALAYLEKARALESDNVTVLRWHATALALLGRNSEALALRRRAAELDPVSYVEINNLAASQFVAGDIQAAEETARRADEIGERVPSTLADILLAQGKTDEAGQVFMRFYDEQALVGATETLNNRMVWSLFAKGAYGGTQADRATARSLIDAYLQAPDAAIGPEILGGLIKLGDPGRALALSERSRDAHAGAILAEAWLPLPNSAALRQHPDFPAFIERIGMADAWRRDGWPDFCRPVSTDADQFSCDGRLPA